MAGSQSAKPFITIDDKAVSVGIHATMAAIEKQGAVAVAAVRYALAQFADKIAMESGPKVPVGLSRGSGSGLRGSWAATDPVMESDGTMTVVCGYNTVYAAMRDQGGTIRPVRAKALFVPIKPGARPGDPNTFLIPRVGKPPLVCTRSSGKRSVNIPEVVAVLVKSVKQKGTFYFTSTVEALRPQAPEMIGRLMAAYVQGAR
ncbi:MAG: hypothetical protein LLG93_07660 [Deltaproteobacteria bacterium]|nr:hypothetical protein [Deltaproteobacteria bacterium]